MKIHRAEVNSFTFKSIEEEKRESQTQLIIVGTRIIRLTMLFEGKVIREIAFWLREREGSD
jgi:hypothetical protein